MAQKGSQTKVYPAAPTAPVVERTLRDFGFPRTITVSPRLFEVVAKDPMLMNRLTVEKATDEMLGDGYWLTAPIVTDRELAERLHEAGRLAGEMKLHFVVKREPGVSLPEYLVYDADTAINQGEPLYASLNFDGVEAWLERRASKRPISRAEEQEQPMTLELNPDAVPTGDPVKLTADRGSAYGAPEDNHGATSDFMAIWLRRKYGVAGRPPRLDAEDVAAFNILQKLSRQANSPKDDNWHDIQGYAQNALDMPGHGRVAPPAPAGYGSPFRTDDDLAEAARHGFARGVLYARAQETTADVKREPTKLGALGGFDAIPQADGDSGDVR